MSEETPLSQLKSKIQSLEINKKYILRTSDAFLTRFLKTAKNDPTKAASRYESYYNTLINLPKAEAFINNDEEEYKPLINAIENNIEKGRQVTENSRQCMPMSYYGLDKSGRKIIAIELKVISELATDDKDRNTNVVLPSFLYGMIALTDYLLENADNGTSSEKEAEPHFVIVEELSGYSMKLFKMITSNKWAIKQLGKLFSGSIPIQVEKIYMVNAPSIFKIIFNIIKALLSSKITSRIEFTGSDMGKVYDGLGGQEFTPDCMDGGEKRAEELNFNIEEQLLKVMPKLRD